VARGDGILRKRLIGEGESKPVGQIVGVIATKEENIDAILSEAGGSGGAAAPAKAPEQVVAQTKEQAGASPVPKTPQQSQGEASTPPQQKVAAAAPPSAPPTQRPPSQARPAASAGGADGGGNGGRTRSSPLARRIASERGLDISGVQGSGPGGRIIKRDIEGAAVSGAAEA